MSKPRDILEGARDRAPRRLIRADALWARIERAAERLDETEQRVVATPALLREVHARQQGRRRFLATWSPRDDVVGVPERMARPRRSRGGPAPG